VKLVGYIRPLKDFRVFRDLTEEELKSHQTYAPVIGEARNRLKLFQILGHNYQEWSNYLNSLLTTKHGEHDEEMLHLDRLLLNYLTCAYTIREHFEASFQRRFRKDDAKQKEHEDYLNRLCTGSWAVAFFFDFRGYVQHVGLGIGFYGRDVSATSVTLTITHDASKLVAESRDWKRSKLSGVKGTLELVPLLREFHVQMLQNYAGFVVRTFFPELIPAAEFYSQLTREVQQSNPEFRMAFTEREPEIRQEGVMTQIKYDLIHVPNDLFPEMGILTPPQPQNA
jgi:hypothetical protein